MAELLTQGSPFDPKSKALMAVLWMKTLEEIGAERFDAAFQQVLADSPFRPSIAEIRRAAKVETAEQWEKRQANEALQAIFTAMREHGTKLRRFKRVEGVLVPAPEIPAVSFPERIEATIARVGYGERVEGLTLLAEHPAVTGNLNGGYANRNAAEVERRWLEAWRASELIV